MCFASPQLPDPEEVVKARQRAEERRRKFTSLPEASGRLADPGGGAAAARRKALAVRLGVGSKSQVRQRACRRLGGEAAGQQQGAERTWRQELGVWAGVWAQGHAAQGAGEAAGAQQPGAMWLGHVQNMGADTHAGKACDVGGTLLRYCKWL